uniref:Uncharacterized protein n=1 Tax=Triticum urartu TaxID=4572 RepID=A0A8R7VA07_TRIUA
MLIFIIYNRNIPEAHNVLLEMFPEVHNTVYLDCQHCQHPNAAVHEDSPETVERLNEALENLGYQDYDLHHSVEAAQYNLMAVRVDWNMGNTAKVRQLLLHLQGKSLVML